ncbi:MAG: apolipoprotein N-acyltransferase, partial [Methylococcaceae bacterium]|nr:apolipoprotein N-acyltransferase [Methylococcaceae bacterium]
LLPILSGIFIGTSYIPFPPWASLFGFVPLWIFWSQQTRLREVVLGGVCTAFVFTLIGFNWVAYLLHEFAHLDWPIAVVGLLVYALIAHLYVPLAGALWFIGQRRLHGSKAWSLGLMALMTILCEAYSFTLFDWNFGYSWYGAGLPIYQWAEFIGFSGLSAATLLCNLPLFWAWQLRKQRAGKILFATVLSLFIILNLGGLWLKARLPEPDASFSTLLVQVSTENSEKMAAELGRGYSGEIFKRYITLTDQALAAHPNTHIDFALWPETAFPALLGDEFTANPLPQALAQYQQMRQLALITGAYSIDPRSQLITNSLFVLNKDGGIVAPHYSKSILLAFGEYIPGEDLFPQIRDWLPATGHFARGNGPTELLGWNGYKMGAQICYESLFPHFSRALAQLGAQFIVNVTNDSWYGSWQEPYQHLYMTLARGVEFRLPVLRVTNTGISTVALASGDILERSPVHQPWTGIYQVPYLKNPRATFYQNWFYLVPGLLWAAVLGMLAWGIAKKRGLLQ